MEDPLRILLLDRDLDARAAALREIRRELPGARAEAIADEESFQRALASGAFDLVLTEPQLSWTDGPGVVDAVKRRHPDRPVVLWVRPGGEPDAARSGADDYV